MTNEQDRDFLLEQDLGLLVPIAKELAAKYAEGITADDVRRFAEARGILLAYTDRGYLCRLQRRLMPRAGLVPGGRGKTPRKGKRGGNDVLLWRRAA